MSEESRNKPLYMISVAAELTGMHPQTLRVYCLLYTSLSL